MIQLGVTSHVSGLTGTAQITSMISADSPTWKLHVINDHLVSLHFHEGPEEFSIMGHPLDVGNALTLALDTLGTYMESRGENAQDNGR